MNVAVILLTQNRFDLTTKVCQNNFYNAGIDADCFLVDTGSDESFGTNYPFAGFYNFKEKAGIAAGVNAGIKLVKSRGNYDGIVLMANDILMPDNWLSDFMYYAIKIPKTGIIGIHCVEELPPLVDGIHKTHTPFGNNYISMELIDTIGGYNTDYDPYGMQDSDYAERAILAGFTNYYIQGRSEHIGHDVGNGTEYRRMKDESLAKAQAVWEKYQIVYHLEKNLYRDLYEDTSNNK
jgi:GT2 family glycosyltransferase